MHDNCRNRDASEWDDSRIQEASVSFRNAIPRWKDDKLRIVEQRRAHTGVSFARTHHSRVLHMHAVFQQRGCVSAKLSRCGREQRIAIIELAVYRKRLIT